MRDIQILDYCDVCWSEDEAKVAATESFVVGIVPGETSRPRLRVLLSCERHAKPVHDLVELMETYGEDFKGERQAKPKLKPKPNDDPGDCPLCGRRFGYLGIHLTEAHHLVLDELLERTADGRVKCPSCDLTATSKHALAVHHRAEHGGRVLAAIAGQQAKAKPKKVVRAR